MMAVTGPPTHARLGPKLKFFGVTADSTRKQKHFLGDPHMAERLSDGSNTLDVPRRSAEPVGEETRVNPKSSVAKLDITA